MKDRNLPSRSSRVAGHVSSVSSLLATTIKSPGGAVVLLTFITGLALREFVNEDLGLAIVASSLVAFIHQVLSRQDELDEIQQALQNVLGENDRRVRELHASHWPLQIWPKGQQPNKEFNDSANAAIRTTRRYDFWGQSGWTHAVRMYHPKFGNIPESKLIVEDARSERVQSARYEEKPEEGRPDPVELADSLKERMRELIMAMHVVTGLRSNYDVRISIAFTSVPSRVRFELLDGVAYVSPSIASRRQGFKYPEVFCYEAHSLPAELARLLFTQQWAQADRVVDFAPGDPPDKVMHAIRELAVDLPGQPYADLRRQTIAHLIRDRHMVGLDTHPGPAG